MQRVSLLLTMRVPTEAVAGCMIVPVGPLPSPPRARSFRAIADLPAADHDETAADDQLVDVSLPPADASLFPVPVGPLVDTPAPTHDTSSPSPSVYTASASDAALVDTLLHHARCLPRGIVQLAQRAQYEPLPFLLARCVEEECECV
ncbi:hypothetical protein B0H19DRAFT_448125 [Mycena capillaripes]|nr:hypothetical protein B0H19DRAFT_446190 [Mycena capillaripes]KAJ6533225.1 hypothetical protein B0H19DRAFT_448125 [Mycena capillaripes]